jgi:hypothetical protein
MESFKITGELPETVLMAFEKNSKSSAVSIKHNRTDCSDNNIQTNRNKLYSHNLNNNEQNIIRLLGKKNGIGFTEIENPSGGDRKAIADCLPLEAVSKMSYGNRQPIRKAMKLNSGELPNTKTPHTCTHTHFRKVNFDHNELNNCFDDKVDRKRAMKHAGS